jgi:hypothetical protein
MAEKKKDNSQKKKVKSKKTSSKWLLALLGLVGIGCIGFFIFIVIIVGALLVGFINYRIYTGVSSVSSEVNMFPFAGEEAQLEYSDYQLGETIDLEYMKVEILEFAKCEDYDLSFWDENEGDVVIMKLKVRNESDDSLSFNYMNMKLADDNGKVYEAENFFYGLEEFSGIDIPSGKLEEGYVSFQVDDSDGEFEFIFDDQFITHPGRGSFSLSVYLGEADEEFSYESEDETGGEVENPPIEEPVSEKGLKEEEIDGGMTRYTSDELGVVVKLPSQNWINYSDYCLAFEPGISIGRMSLDEHGSVSRCFVTEFGKIGETGGIKEVKESDDTVEIGGEEYDIKVQRLIYGDTSESPQGGIDYEGMDDDVYFFLVLSGDPADPFREDFLALDYYGSWAGWDMGKDNIKKTISNIQFEK